MKKNLRKELQEMKFLFGYERGRVISEQKNFPKEDNMEMMVSDVEFAEPDTETEKEVKPDVDRETSPSRPTRRERTFDPSRFDPATRPEPHPQGKEDDEIEFELELDNKHFGDMGDEKMFDAEIDEPYTMDVDDTDVDSIEALVKKYLNSKG